MLACLFTFAAKVPRRPPIIAPKNTQRTSILFDIFNFKNCFRKISTRKLRRHCAGIWLIDTKYASLHLSALRSLVDTTIVSVGTIVSCNLQFHEITRLSPHHDQIAVVIFHHHVRKRGVCWKKKGNCTHSIITLSSSRKTNQYSTHNEEEDDENDVQLSPMVSPSPSSRLLVLVRPTTWAVRFWAAIVDRSSQSWSGKV